MIIMRMKLALIALWLTFSVNAQAQSDMRVAWQVSRYEITADVSAAASQDRTLAARATIHATNVGGASGRTLTSRLNPSAKVNSVTAGGARANFTTDTDAQTKLLMVKVTLPEAVPPGGDASVTIEYSLRVNENTGLLALSPEGSQFLPDSFWYPTPNTPVAPRGADYASFRLTINGAGADSAVSSGRAANGGFEESLYTQPFFLTGKWETIEGAGDARGVSAFVHAGASAEEGKRAEEVIALAASARSFYAELLGGAPDTPVRLVSVRRGGGFSAGGTVLLDSSVFRRAKTDAATALHIAESIARIWVGGATQIQGDGAGVLREGLPRYLALRFIEKRFGREAAHAEFARVSLLYSQIARRDAPLSRQSPAFDTYFNSVANKGALVWRLIAERFVGQETFDAMLRREFDPAKKNRVSLASVRVSLGARASDSLRAAFETLFDNTTDTDLMIGAPRKEASGWVSALRNFGSLDADINVTATTASGERVTSRVKVSAKGEAEARFPVSAQVVSVEADPERLYPQTDFSKDVAPWLEADALEMLKAARAQLGQNPARAEQAARSILSRIHYLQEARTLLARALLAQNKLPEAEKEFRAAFESALPTSSTLAWTAIGLGELALRRGQNAEAARRFDEAVRADADYETSLNARAARLRAEASANAKPPVDEAASAAASQLDAAIRSGRKSEIDNIIIQGELSDFSKGVVSSQPEIWETRLLRTEAQGANRIAADVEVKTRALGQDKAGTAVFVFARTPSGWKLADIQLFEVR